MKMRKVIDKISELYDAELLKLAKLQYEFRDVRYTIIKADEELGKNITVSDYRDLQRIQKELERKIDIKCQYCQVIYRVWEMLINMGADTEVE